MSVQSQKPPGITAALALQTLDDIETDRFSMFERAHEEFYVDLGRQMIEVVKEIVSLYGDMEVMGANRPSWSRLSWERDVYVPEDSYVVQSWPTSLLPKTPAAKLQRVLELSAQGIFDKPQVLKLLGLPDTTTEELLLLAPRTVVDLQIATILCAEDPLAVESFQAPNKYMDLAYGLSRAQAYYDRILAEATQQNTVNEEITIKRLNALSQYMDQCKTMIDEAQAEMQAKMAAAAAMQLGQGAPVTAAVPGPQGPLQPIPGQQGANPAVPQAAPVPAA
jgi:hypothetical protein